jgi:hypothetical protein
MKQSSVNELMLRAWHNIYNDYKKQRTIMTTQSTLEQLVQDTVNTFITLEQSFSVYDVTTNIRSLVNSGAVIPSDLYYNVVDNFYDIPHSEVKAIFTDLVEDNGFDAPLTKDFNGSYFLYTPAIAPPTGVAQAAQAFLSTSPSQALVDALLKIPNATVVKFGRNAGRPLNFGLPVGKKVAAAVAKASGNSLDRTTVINRVKQYLNGCKARKANPTPRQIQSAIKRNGKSTGWSRSELSQIRRDIEAGNI